MNDELSHGLLLFEQGRLDEAEACFVGLVAREPENDAAHGQLAMCRMRQEGKKSEALESIDEAIRLNPEEATYFGLKAMILDGLGRTRPALDAAERAIGMEPESPLGYVAKAMGLASVNRWKEAEENCRMALAIDPDNSMAGPLLTSVLRFQGKSQESDEEVGRQLSENPEDSLAHANAGWAALTRRDHRKAEEHFREALRLDPGMDSARDGLIESFKARSWFYRRYLEYSFFMARFTQRMQWVLIIGAYLAYRLLRESLERVSPLAVVIVTIVWLTFVLWVWLAPGIGNFLIILDRSARRALKRKELALGLWIGLALILGIGGAAVGYPAGIAPLTALALAAVASTIPASLTFTNESRKGRLVFGGVLGITVLAGLGGVGIAAMNGEVFNAGSLIALLAGVICTWLGNVPALRRDDSG